MIVLYTFRSALKKAIWNTDAIGWSVRGGGVSEGSDTLAWLTEWFTEMSLIYAKSKKKKQ